MRSYLGTVEGGERIVQWLEKRQPQDASLSEVEHIVDYLLSEDAPKRLDRATYSQMQKNTEKWVKKLAKRGSHIQESEEDVKTVLDFGDGFRVVQLIGENAYKREGYLMSHCVASYADKDVEVYSLRDKNNMPH